MPDAQPTPNLHDDPRFTEREIIFALTNPRDNQPLWSLDDLGRDLGDQLAVVDAVHRLQCAGLVHHTADGYVFATRAAIRLIQIVGCVI
jgi:hypothetical protein